MGNDGNERCFHFLSLTEPGDVLCRKDYVDYSPPIVIDWGARHAENLIFPARTFQHSFRIDASSNRSCPRTATHIYPLHLLEPDDLFAPLPDRLSGRNSEEIGKRLVHGLHHALAVEDDDPIRVVLDHRFQKRFLPPKLSDKLRISDSYGSLISEPRQDAPIGLGKRRAAAFEHIDHAEDFLFEHQRQGHDLFEREAKPGHLRQSLFQS